ncbi:MAG: serine/threonine-protein kinase, partial [Planctomycetota bacterium]
MKPVSPTKICVYLVSEKILKVQQIAECQQLKEQQGTGKTSSILDSLLNKGYLTSERLHQAEKRLQQKDFDYGTLIEPETEPFDPNVPEKFVHFFEGYELLKRLGKGGMGVVYLGNQLSMDRKVAVKVLSKGLAEDKEYVGRFLIEARASAKFNHPNVVRGIDVAEQGGYHFFVMEYVEGQTAAAIALHQEISEALTLEIAYCIASALQYATTIQMIHRDIKPDNIMVTHEGEIKLLDLGLAKEVGNDSPEKRLLGTPHFASPEQIRGDKLDIRTDIYSLGATLYQLLTKTFPYDGKTIPILLTRVLTEKWPNPREIRNDLSDGMVQLLQKMMEKQREKRIASPEILLEEIQKLRKQYLPSFEEESRKQNKPLQTRMLQRQFVLNQLSRPASKIAKKKKKTSPLLFALPVLAIVGALVLILFFFNTSKTSPEKNPSGSEKTEINKDPEVNPPIDTTKTEKLSDAEIAQKEFWAKLQESLSTELAQEIIPMGTALDWWEKIQTFQAQFPKSPFSVRLEKIQQQILEKLEKIGEREFKVLQQKEEELLKTKAWEEARKIWNRFPSQLKMTSWPSKVKEAQESFFQRYNPYEEDVALIRKYLENFQLIDAKKLLHQMKIYANPQQSEALAIFDEELLQKEKQKQQEEVRKAMKAPPDSFENYPAEFAREVEPLLQSTENRFEHYEEAIAFLEEAKARYPFNTQAIEYDLSVVKTLQSAWKEIFQFFEEAIQKKEELTIGSFSATPAKTSLKEGTLSWKGKKTLTVILSQLDSETFNLYAASALKSFQNRSLKLGLFAFFSGEYAFAADQLSKVRGTEEEWIQSYLSRARQNREVIPKQEVQRLFSEAQKLTEKKDFWGAKQRLSLLQNRYAQNEWVLEKQKTLDTLAKTVTAELFSFDGTQVKKLRSLLQGKITSQQKAYQIQYDFMQPEQIQDFELHSPTAPKNLW